MTTDTDIGEVQCPVCGYYCLGKGGFGCINKPAMIGEDNMTTDTDRVEELAKWHDREAVVANIDWHYEQAAMLRSLSAELTEWKTRCAELEQNAAHIQSSDEAEDLKLVLADCSTELTELRQAKESLDWWIAEYLSGRNFNWNLMPPYLKSRLEAK